MTIRDTVIWARRHVSPRDWFWGAALSVAVLSAVFMSSFTRQPDDIRATRDTPAVIVVQRGGDEPDPIVPEVTPPTHVIHLACDTAQRELELAVEAALDWSGDLDRLLRGAEGKTLGADPRLVAQFQLLRGRERVAVTEIRRRMTEVRTIRADESIERDDEKARAVFTQVLDIAAWGRGVAESYRADDRLLDSMNWTAHRLGIGIDEFSPDLASAARHLWDDADLGAPYPTAEPEPAGPHDLAFYGDASLVPAIPADAPSRREVPRRKATVLRKPAGESGWGEATSKPRRMGSMPERERSALNVVDLIRANLEWNGLTDVSLRYLGNKVIAKGAVQSEREMAELEAIVQSVLQALDIEFENRVRVES